MLNLRQVRLCVSVLLLALTLWSAGAGAATLYQYEEDRRFWWFVGANPAFELLVPAYTGGDYPIYGHVSQFGLETLDIYMGQNGPILTVGILRGTQSTIPRLRDNLLASRQHLFTNRRVLSDREITTGTGERAYFYAQTADAADGKKAMFRAVFFNRDNYIVYLTLFLYEDDFTGFNDEAWRRAVNTFRWL